MICESVSLREVLTRIDKAAGAEGPAPMSVPIQSGVRQVREGPPELDDDVVELDEIDVELEEIEVELDEDVIELDEDVIELDESDVEEAVFVLVKRRTAA